MNNSKKTCVIIGAGPAGLTAAFELLNRNKTISVIVVEATDRIGGISCTLNHNGNRIDIGGHRFFSKSDTVMDWWLARMAVQGFPARDDIELDRDLGWSKDGPNPEESNDTLLIRRRISRIFYLRKFFDYPLSLSVKTVRDLGIGRTIEAGFGYLVARLLPQKNEETLDRFLINRFGKPLYRMFFENYTAKVWGISPDKISAAWGAQRIKGLSLSRAVITALKAALFGKQTGIHQKGVETSLIEQFLYPKYGPGHLWEVVAREVTKDGGKILMSHEVISLSVVDNNLNAIEVRDPNGNLLKIECDYCVSSMPIKHLIPRLKSAGVSDDLKSIAEGLPYRDFVTFGILVNRLAIKNETEFATVNDVIPDTWVYVQEPDVQLCRLQIFNNWSPYLVNDPNTVWLGLEYMCSENDPIWTMSDKEAIDFAISELVSIGFIEENDVLDSCRFKIEKAYPAYFGTYDRFDELKNFLNSIPNLFCVGRNGQHRYNNQDHSMLTAMHAVDSILGNSSSKESLWDVNVEKTYHEEK